MNLIQKLDNALGGGNITVNRKKEVYCKRAAIIRFLRYDLAWTLNRIGTAMAKASCEHIKKQNEHYQEHLQYNGQHHTTIINALKPKSEKYESLIYRHLLELRKLDIDKPERCECCGQIL